MKRIVPPSTTGLIGYARVSTLEQSIESQTAALKKAGCLKIFTDTASGKRADRPGLEDAMEFLREGDTLVVWKLDRLGRSLQHLVEILHTLQERKIHFRSLQEHIDTGSAAGRMFFNLIATFAEYERELIAERTTAGLAAARARGRFGGRPKLLSDKKIAQAKVLRAAGTPLAQIAATLNCSSRTLGRYL